MTHTAELHTMLSREEYLHLFRRKDIKTEADKRHHIRSLSTHGITDICPHRYTKPGFTFYYCTAIINLERLVNGGKRTVKTYQNESDFEKLDTTFTEYMKEVLPSHSSVNGWDVARIDYNIDILLSDQREVEQYIALLQMGDKASSWKVHETETEAKKRKQSKHGQRRKGHPTGSVLYDNQRYSVNIYNKLLERQQEQEKRGVTDKQELKEAERILRIEVQSKRGKLQYLKKKNYGQELAGRPLQAFACFEMSENTVTSVLKTIVGEADYLSMERAKTRIRDSPATKRATKNLIAFLRTVQARKSVWNAKKHYDGSMKPESIIKRLQGLNINPVTIPNTFGKEEMENLYHRVCVQFAEEKAIQQNGY